MQFWEKVMQQHENNSVAIFWFHAAANQISCSLYACFYGWSHMCGLWGHSVLDLLIKEMWSLHPWGNVCRQSVGNPASPYWDVCIAQDTRILRSHWPWPFVHQYQFRSSLSLYPSEEMTAASYILIWSYINTWWDLKSSILISSDPHQLINAIVL